MLFTHYHRCHDVIWCSDRPIDGLGRVREADRCDVRVELNVSETPCISMLRPLFHCDEREPNGRPSIIVSTIVDSTLLHVDCAGEVKFIVDRDGRHVTLAMPNARKELVDAYLIGAIIPIVLRLRGASLLHGCAADIVGETVGIVGESGSGKSTLAAALLDNGHRAVSDDVLRLLDREGGTHIAAGETYLRLWPDDFSVKGETGRELLPIVEGWPKRRLDLVVIPNDNQTSLLRRLYVLRRVEAGQSLSITSLEGAIALAALLEHSMIDSLLPSSARRLFFSRLALCVERVPVFRLDIPESQESQVRIADLSRAVQLLQGATPV